MTFDKKAYWKRREANKRGQVAVKVPFHAKGVKVKRVKNIDGVLTEVDYPNGLGRHVVSVGGVPQLLNRKDYRSSQKNISRYSYRTKTQHVGEKVIAGEENTKKYTQANAVHAVNDYREQWEKPDPSKNNHQRLMERRKK